ncbi:MAG TPA: tail fiber protein [Paludibacter sp.]|nr:tail fiber protein [Paludibacter sp.]
MKRIYTFILAISFIAVSFAQAPQKLNYQAVIRNSANAILSNTQVGIRISILQGSASGTVVYTETQTPTTNANGLLNLEIGSGAGFSTIDWNAATYFVKTETDPTGGTNYSITGTSQLLSVPYALNAKSLGTAGTNGQILSYKNNNWVATDITTTTSVGGGSQPFSTLQPYLVLNYQIALYGIFPSRNGIEPFIGEIMITPYNFAVKDFALCNGQLLSIAQNTALFSLLGTTYGGNGQTTFALPDLRGRVPVHYGQGPGLSSYQLGESGGSETTTLLQTQMPAHTHTITLTQH